MRPLSPADAIAPSFARARTILLPPGPVPGQPGPFRFWFFFKIALVAALTNASFYGFTMGMAGQSASTATMGLGRHRFLAFDASGFTAIVVALLALAALIGLILWVVLGWLWCRLRFTLFDLVVYRHGQVGPAWSRYGRPAWRYLGLLALISVVLLGLAGLTAGPLILHFIATIRHLGSDQINANPAIIFAHIFPIYGILLFFGLVGSLADALLQDFVLPPMALENAPLPDAFARFFALLREHPGSVVLYLLLRFVLQLGLSWVGALAIFLVLGILGLGGAGVGFLLFRSLWHAGAAGIAAFILYCAVAGVILIGLYLLSTISLYGSVTTFRQCYAAFFYGSHYPLLGDLLEPPMPLPAEPAPLPPPPPLEEPPDF